jgi:predicted signal transduction protein with EAL and GGDEF domain
MPYIVLGSPAVVGTSVGIEIASDGADATAIKASADRALYAAKAAGKGQAIIAGMRDAA